MTAEQFRESNQELQKSICAGLISAAPAVRKFGEACQQFDNTVKREYEAAGAPYGNTMEGRYRWLNEMAVTARDNQKQREVIADAKLMLTLRSFFA